MSYLWRTNLNHFRTHPHTKQYHKEYADWVRRWLKLFLLVDIPILVVWIVVMYYWFEYWYPASLGLTPFIVVTVAYCTSISMFIAVLARKTQSSDYSGD